MRHSYKDRRPWLILSRAEVEALIAAALHNNGREPWSPPPDLVRAIHVADLQMRWIDGAAGGVRPNIERSLDGQHKKAPTPESGGQSLAREIADR